MRGKNKVKILILVNHDMTIYQFRLELVERLLADGYEVHISSPYGERIDDLVACGAVYHRISIDRHGMNPLKDLSVLRKYQKLMSEICPTAVLSYTVKPNVYGGIAARWYHIPFIATVTGLGISVGNGGIKEKIVLRLYKTGLWHAQLVCFQNKENMNFMLRHGVVKGAYCLLPGSGVNLLQHCQEPYPENENELIFTTIGRIMKDKGTNELLIAARAVKMKYPKVRFRLIGSFEDDYRSVIEAAVAAGTVEYIEQQKDIHSFIMESHAIVHPSYHEGMSNVLLEASATGRPVLASDIPGCRETFDEGVSGFGFTARNSESLVRAIEKFINLPYEKKVKMGQAGRTKMEREFDRSFVVKKYMEEIEKL